MTSHPQIGGELIGMGATGVVVGNVECQAIPLSNVQVAKIYKQQMYAEKDLADAHYLYGMDNYAIFVDSSSINQKPTKLRVADHKLALQVCGCPPEWLDTSDVWYVTMQRGKVLGIRNLFLKKLRNIYEGVKILSSRNVAHMDLKEANIVLGNDGQLKMIDFNSMIYPGMLPNADTPVTGAYLSPWANAFIEINKWGTLDSNNSDLDAVKQTIAILENLGGEQQVLDILESLQYHIETSGQTLQNIHDEFIAYIDLYCLGRILVNIKEKIDKVCLQHNINIASIPNEVQTLIDALLRRPQLVTKYVQVEHFMELDELWDKAVSKYPTWPLLKQLANYI